MSCLRNQESFHQGHEDILCFTLKILSFYLLLLNLKSVEVLCVYEMMERER